MNLDLEKKLNQLATNQVDRLFFIENRLRYCGSVNRKDLVERFGIKGAAATRDFALYRELGPDNAIFDSKSRSYLISETFEGIFGQRFSTRLRVQNAAYDQPCSAETIPNVGEEALDDWEAPRSDVLDMVTQAIANNTYLSVRYFSLSSVSKDRKIAPFVVLNNGTRWYTRAFDTKRNAFRDFIINRMSSPILTAEPVSSDHLPVADNQWTRFVELKIAAHNCRENLQRPETIEHEYGMRAVTKTGEDGEGGQRKDLKILPISIRAALVGYLLRNWNVDCSADHSLVGKEYQLRLMNLAALYGVTNLNLAPGYKAPEY